MNKEFEQTPGDRRTDEPGLVVHWVVKSLTLG